MLLTSVDALCTNTNICSSICVCVCVCARLVARHAYITQNNDTITPGPGPGARQFNILQTELIGQQNSLDNMHMGLISSIYLIYSLASV